MEKIKCFVLSKNENFATRLANVAKDKAEISTFCAFCDLLDRYFVEKCQLCVIDEVSVEISYDAKDIFKSKIFMGCNIIFYCDKNSFLAKSECAFDDFDDLFAEFGFLLLQKFRQNARSVRAQNQGRISKLLKELGFSTKCIGTTYLKGAIEYLSKNEDPIKSYSKDLYPKLVQNDQNAKNIERDIRNAIKWAFENDEAREFRESLNFGYKKNFPANKTFISQICDYLENEQTILDA